MLFASNHLPYLARVLAYPPSSLFCGIVIVIACAGGRSLEGGKGVCEAIVVAPFGVCPSRSRPFRFGELCAVRTAYGVLAAEPVVDGAFGKKSLDLRRPLPRVS